MLLALCPFSEGLDGFPEDVTLEQISEGHSAGPRGRSGGCWHEPLSRPLCPRSPLLCSPALSPCRAVDSYQKSRLTHLVSSPSSSVGTPLCGPRAPAPLTFFVHPPIPLSASPPYPPGDTARSHHSHIRDWKRTSPLSLVLRPISEPSLSFPLQPGFCRAVHTCTLLAPHSPLQSGLYPHPW